VVSALDLCGREFHFYYYLTRDADVVQDILAVKNYIFDKYYTRRQARCRLPKMGCKGGGTGTR